MLSIDEALQAVLTEVEPLPPQRVPLGRAYYRYLMEDVVSDVDSPPHDKSMMDGYAVRVGDFSAAGEADLLVVEEVTAGKVPSRTLEPGQAIRIMTGAPIPAGTEAVVMVERTTTRRDGPNEYVRIQDPKLRAGQHIMRHGEIMRAGEVVLAATNPHSKQSQKLTGPQIGLLAEVGCTHVMVSPTPHVCVVSTGDELVPFEQVPGPGQIRNSNGPMLAAASRWSDPEAIENLGIARDNREELLNAMRKGMTADVFLLSGGVSAGVLDLVPGLLQELGVRPVFHKVHMKPGKPIWFGVYQRPDGRKCLVFGLVGNPVGSFVGWHVFVLPALHKLIQSSYGVIEFNRPLAHDYEHRGDRPTFHPGVTKLLGDSEETKIVTPLRWKGSADLRTLAQANVLIRLPAGPVQFKAGDKVPVQFLIN